jgi:GNAT superfamily N-acetyltransferase
MSFRIRCCRPNDPAIESVRSLRKSVFADELRQYPTTLARLAGREDGVYLIAESDSDVIGMLYISRGSPYEWQRHLPSVRPAIESAFEVGRLCVLPKRRGKHVSTALIAAAAFRYI